MKWYFLSGFLACIITISLMGANQEPGFPIGDGGNNNNLACLEQDTDGKFRLCTSTIVKSGEITTTPGGIADKYYEFFRNGGSSDMRVDGSSTTQTFSIPLDSTKTVFVQQIRCFGGASGAIKYGGFLSSNQDLTNGLTITIKSDDNTFTFPVIKNSEDFKNTFSFPLTNAFLIEQQAGADQFIAIFNPTNPFPLKKTGTHSPDDKVTIDIDDDISGPPVSLNQFMCLAHGFRRLEP